MTAALPSHAVSTAVRSHGQHGVKQLEKSYGNCIAPEDAERKWFAGLLWKAFPEARSENDLSELVADVLATEKRPIHPRTVRNWIRCDNTPHFRYVMRIIALAGAESLFQIIDAEDGI